MPLRRLIVLLMLSGIAILPNYGQQIPVKSLTTASGLSMSYVTTAFQDSRGFIWMGTFFGLNRYDGEEVKVYRPNHLSPFALHANKIQWILEDAFGLLWLCTENGIAVMDTHSERIAHLEIINNIPIRNIRKAVLDKNGRLWFYQQNKENLLMLGIQTNAGIKARIRQGEALEKFDVASIPLPQGFGTALNAFLQTSDSTAVVINQKGNCALVNLMKRTALLKKLEEVSLFISPKVRYIPDPLNSSGTLFFSNHDFSNGIMADQIHQYLQLPNGKTLISRFYDPKIYVLNKLTELAAYTGEDPFSQLSVFYTLPYPSTFSRLIDRNGDLWIGTTGYGIFRISTNTRGFLQIAREYSIYNFALLPDQTLWAGFLAPETIIDLSASTTRPSPWQTFFGEGDQVKAVLTAKNKRHVYLFVQLKAENRAQGFLYDPDANTLSKIPVQLLPLPTPPVLMEDLRGNLWISGNAAELLRFNPQNQKVHNFNLEKSFPPEIVAQMTTTDMLQAKNGHIWIANSYGLIKIMQPEKEQPNFKLFHNYTGEKKTFANNGIFAIHQDTNQPDILWLGTLGNGLAKFHLPSEKVSYLSPDNSSKHQIILGIVPDEAQRLWLSTSDGITCFDPVKNQFISFDLQEVLQRPAFNAAAFGRLPGGEILFGSAEGLFVLQAPMLLNANATMYSKKIQLGEVKVNDATIHELVGQGKALFSDDELLQLDLPHDENNVLINFAAPFARNPSSLYYRYKVQGLSDQWITAGNRHSVSLTGLSPGRYKMYIEVAAPSNKEAQPPTALLEITIRPPWYASNLARSLYLVIIALAVFSIARFSQRRLSEKYTSEMNQQEMQRLQSLDQFKNKFFAYIAHEIKTPLSIILGISDKLRENKTNTAQNKFLDAIQYEGYNMLGLIDEIIDITRMQEGSIQLDYRHGNIADFIKNLLTSYQTLADSQEITLHFHTENQEIYADFDKSRVRYILNNLLNNALRHTPGKGSITISLKTESDKVRVEVSDTGKGIAEADIPLIFEKYYQGINAEKTEHNFGLGLSYVKDLVELMHGKISVNSRQNQGTTFVVHLPVSAPINTPTSPLELEAPVLLPPDLSEQTIFPNHPDLPLLLIVEDNPMIVSVLKLALQPYFRLLVAKDGKEGLNLAIIEIPDLILTDSIMPVMDGLEMTKILKANPLTAHIPVVVLSAKNETSDRLEGQECGAEAYIGKPYHTRELLLTLRNLQTLQSKWKLRYANYDSKPSAPPTDFLPSERISQGALSAGDKFMKSLYDAFKNHYSSEAFDIPQLCRILHISKAQLYRKLSAVSDQGPMELLKDFRLEKAMELPQNNPDLSTSEVAFQVGFRERTHFSTQFKKKFGVAPSMVRAKT